MRENSREDDTRGEWGNGVRKSVVEGKMESEADLETKELEKNSLRCWRKLRQSTPRIGWTWRWSLRQWSRGEGHVGNRFFSL